MTTTVTEPTGSHFRNDVPTAQHLVNGEWLGGADTPRWNPARPHELAAYSPSGGTADVDAAVTAAAAAQPAWAALPAPARGAILMTAANLLQERGSVVAADLVQEDKTLAEARGEVTRAVDVLRFFGSLGWTATGEMLPSGLPGTSVTTRREHSSRATRWRSSPPNSHPCPPPTLPATDSPRESAPTASLARRTSRPGRRPASSRSTARPPGST